MKLPFSLLLAVSSPSSDVPAEGLTETKPNLSFPHCFSLGRFITAMELGCPPLKWAAGTEGHLRNKRLHLSACCPLPRLLPFVAGIRTQLLQPFNRLKTSGFPITLQASSPRQGPQGVQCHDWAEPILNFSGVKAPNVSLLGSYCERQPNKWSLNTYSFHQWHL